jgi:sugar lactone lactonase YvrE
MRSSLVSVLFASTLVACSDPLRVAAPGAGDDATTDPDPSTVDGSISDVTTPPDEGTEAAPSDSFANDTLANDTLANDTLANDGASDVPDAIADGQSEVPSEALACGRTEKVCGASCVPRDGVSTGCGGASCAPCPSSPWGTPICDDTAACSFRCNSGYFLCDGACVGDDPKRCGSACTVCPTPENAVSTCTSGGCGFACTGTYADCNKAAKDGCEIDLQSDPANCGECGHSCLGDGCKAGRCEPKVLAINQSDPSDLAVDGQWVFFTNTGAGEVARVPKVGGNVVVLASGEDAPTGIAIDDKQVYYSNTYTPGSIKRVGKEGGKPIVLTEDENFTYYAYRLIVDATSLYWVTDTTTGKVVTMPKVGGAPTILQNKATSPKGLAFDGTSIFWPVFGEIRRAPPVANAPPTKLSASEQFPSALAADEGAVYWTDMYAATVRRVPKAGGTPTTLATMTAGARLGAIAVDATHVFFLDPQGNTVRKVPKTGGPAVTIAIANAPRGLALDETHVYWTNGGDGTVMRVAK